jgi:hypothetical protein
MKLPNPDKFTAVITNSTHLDLIDDVAGNRMCNRKDALGHILSRAKETPAALPDLSADHVRAMVRAMESDTVSTCDRLETAMHEIDPAAAAQFMRLYEQIRTAQRQLGNVLLSSDLEDPRQFRSRLPADRLSRFDLDEFDAYGEYVD